MIQECCRCYQRFVFVSPIFGGYYLRFVFSHQGYEITATLSMN